MNNKFKLLYKYNLTNYISFLRMNSTKGGKEIWEKQGGGLVNIPIVLE